MECPDTPEIVRRNLTLVSKDHCFGKRSYGWIVRIQVPTPSSHQGGPLIRLGATPFSSFGPVIVALVVMASFPPTFAV